MRSATHDQVGEFRVVVVCLPRILSRGPKAEVLLDDPEERVLGQAGVQDEGLEEVLTRI